MRTAFAGVSARSAWRFSLVPVLVEVDASVLRARLLARGREQGGDIEERIARASMPAEYPDGTLYRQPGPLVESTAAFTGWLRG